LLGDRDELIGQLLKALEVGHLSFRRRRLIGRDALGELLALEIALEDEVGPRTRRTVRLAGAEELAAERTAAHVVQRAHLLEDLIAPVL